MRVCVVASWELTDRRVWRAVIAVEFVSRLDIANVPLMYALHFHEGTYRAFTGTEGRHHAFGLMWVGSNPPCRIASTSNLASGLRRALIPLQNHMVNVTTR